MIDVSQPKGSHRGRNTGAWRPAVQGLLLAACLAWIQAAQAAASDQADGLAGPSLAQRSRALERAHLAVLGVQTQAVDKARSARTLGQAREGSGVVIGADGLVLTIGYLVLEAESASLQLPDARSVPARVVGYDVATGLGLLQALAPLGIEPVPLATAGQTGEGQPLTIISGGVDAVVSPARLEAQGPFSAYWEYRLERALITAPARRDHTGAGLFTADGELLGIGSLYLADTSNALDQPGPLAKRPLRASGNLFVPAALLPPILDELRTHGRSRASERAWLGLNCAEADGELRVMRVTDDSPADLAGLQAGDRIVRIDGRPVDALATLWQSLWTGGPAERAIRIDIQRAGQPQELTVYSVDRAKTLQRPQGI